MFSRNRRLALMGIRFADFGTEPAEGVGSEAGDEGDWTLPPVWEQAMADVPDVLRGKMIAQIRTSEREAQRAIETARGNDVDPTWRALAKQAREAQLSPDELVDAYNNQTALREEMQADPDGFLAALTTQIDQLVASGQLTRAQGRKAKENAAELASPEQEEIEDLRNGLDQVRNQLTAREQADLDRETERAADAYGQSFEQALTGAFAADEQLSGASAETQLAVARIAASIMDNDASETVTMQQAIGEGIRQLRAAAGLFSGQAPAAQQQQQTTAQRTQLPVGGGQAPQPQARRFSSEEERDNAMIALAASMGAASD